MDCDNAVCVRQFRAVERMARGRDLLHRALFRHFWLVQYLYSTWILRRATRLGDRAGRLCGFSGGYAGRVLVLGALMLDPAVDPVVGRHDSVVDNSTCWIHERRQSERKGHESERYYRTPMRLCGRQEPCYCSSNNGRYEVLD